MTEARRLRLAVEDRGLAGGPATGPFLEEGALMAAANTQSGDPQATEGGGSARVRVPMMQRVLDNPFLLLFLGVVMPTVFYVIWGIMEIIQIPIAE